MKKYFYLAAVSAMMLTACSSENDVVQPTTQPTTPQVAVQQQAVAFDTYLSGTTASTRAGDPTGVMTTEKLKIANKGFGVMAFYQDGTNYAGTSAPNFMYNEQISWASGWTYSPLKYWPNETKNDSQDPAASSTQTDKLSFFAYAPYVTTGAAPLNSKADVAIDASTNFNAYYGTETSGITAISSETYAKDPLVKYAVSSDPDNIVDLLWGVAPAGFSYTNVSGTTTSVPVGMPLKDLVKPDKDQKVKFLFQHALSRIGLTVVSAIDQIAAGDDAGTFTSDPTTKVLIKNVQVWGDFGKNGVLNLNNTDANKANWITTSIAKSGKGDTDPLFWFDNGTAIQPSGSAPYNAANSYIAADLRYVQGQIDAVTNATTFADVNTGVLPSEQPLLASGVDPSKLATDLTYEVGKKLYKLSGSDYVRATTTSSSAVDVFKKVSSNWVQVYKTSGVSKITLNGDEEAYYTLAETSKTGDEVKAAIGSTFFIKTVDGTTSLITYTKHVSDGTESSTDGNVYVSLAATALVVDNYTGPCYTALQPRYFMVIPTGSTPIKVKITYAVVTLDTKLTGNVSNVQNDITKEVTVNLENGKSYNLKLILGLTSVKLDATVADWKVADETEIWLPQNNE